jgi:hypothetical protein
MQRRANNSIDRRDFLKAAGVSVAAAGACVALPGIVTAKRRSAQNLVGQGDHQFECAHGWPQLPKPYSWQITHNVAVDGEGLLYVIHEGDVKKTDHPSIFVFDQSGKMVRCFGAQFQGGGHGIEIRTEGSEQFLYVAAYQQAKTFAKMTLDGQLVWQQYAPTQSEVYRKDEASNPSRRWARDAFMPTNFAFLDDGGFLLADGYGAFYIHRYDKDGNWLSCFGGAGDGKGTFNTPHGVGIDARPGREEPEIVVTDRAHNTLQTFTMDGRYKNTQDGFGLPANVETHNDLMVVPELVARVSLLDDKNKVVATLGDDIQRIVADRDANKGFVIRTKEDQWQQGKFVHPHDACFDADGNIFVAEWVTTGRITRLKRA